MVVLNQFLKKQKTKEQLRGQEFHEERKTAE